MAKKDYIEEYKNAYDYYEPVRNTWAEKEALVIARNMDSHSSTTKSDVHDPRLISIIMERSFRVMSQLASGKVQALSKADKGKSILMDLILDKYVLKNANQQRDILTKFRMVDFYSLVYGSYGILVDWHVTPTYTGPDFRMLPIRDFIPQPGKTSSAECEYMYVKTDVSRAWLKEVTKRDKTKWNKKAIEELLAASEGNSPKQQNLDLSFSERKLDSSYTESNSANSMIALVTKYEGDKWTTFARDFTGIQPLREVDNQHKNNKIPVIIKDAFPLIDRFHGLGEIERGKSLQYAVNSLINLYLDGVKFSLFPPLKIDAQNVVMSTIKQEGGAKWLLKNGQMDAVQSHMISPQGLNTFQSTYSFLIAAMMNQAGTTDTTISQGTDPGLGKTPQALSLLAERQNSRDAYDRFQMEQFVEKTYDVFLDLLACKQEDPIKLTLFKDEIAAIEKHDSDVTELFSKYDSGEAGELVINPDYLKDEGEKVDYKFYIEPGSTYKRDEVIENQSLQEMIQLVISLPGAVEQVMQTGNVRIGDMNVDVGEMLKRFLITKGIQDWDKIIKPIEESEMEGGEANYENDPQIQQLLEEFQAGMPQGTPMPGMEQGPQDMPPMI